MLKAFVLSRLTAEHLPSRQDANGEAEDMGEGTAPAKSSVCSTATINKVPDTEVHVRYDGQIADEDSAARGLQKLHIKASERPAG